MSVNHGNVFKNGKFEGCHILWTFGKSYRIFSHKCMSNKQIIENQEKPLNSGKTLQRLNGFFQRFNDLFKIDYGRF